MYRDKIETPCGNFFWVEEHQILRVNYIYNTDLKGTKQHIHMLKKYLIQNKLPSPALAISDANQITDSVKKDVRDYLASEELLSICKASALLVNSGISKAIGNLYLTFSKPRFPTKLFTNEQKALEWLQTVNQA